MRTWCVGTEILSPKAPPHISTRTSRFCRPFQPPAAPAHLGKMPLGFLCDLSISPEILIDIVRFFPQSRAVNSMDPHTADKNSKTDSLPGHSLETPSAPSENVEAEAISPLNPLQEVPAADGEPTSAVAEQTFHADDTSSTEGSSRLEVSREHSCFHF